MLDDPRVNFAISTRGRQPGLDHLGIQAESGEELEEIYARLHTAGGNIVEQGSTACCYAKSEKSWIDDPAGISWETFHTTGESIDYGDGSGERVARVAHETAHETSCCAPAPQVAEPAAACGSGRVNAPWPINVAVATPPTCCCKSIASACCWP